MTKILLDFMAAGTDPFPADHLGEGYRCSVDLVDGTVLPCVMLRKPGPIVDLAQRRIAEEGKGKGVFSRSKDPSREILAHFLTSGNRVSDFNVKKVTPSRYALPLSLLDKIEGETTMAWTGFVFEMSDGQLFSYGSSFQFQFFDLPAGYGFDDVVTVHNHSYVDDAGVVREIHADMDGWRRASERIRVYRERPYFDCFVRAGPSS